jgi:myo-inositol 2-dehydrogenase / D-chiro-inositol 1-dehydrogenase
MSVRIAIIGAGLMGTDHARIIAEDVPGAILQIICDQDVKRAKEVADHYGAFDVMSDTQGAIHRADVDAIIIASPDFTHAPLTLACIRAGKKVLCEKPLSQSSTECILVIDAEHKAGAQFVQLGFMRRFDQSYVEMREALKSGQLGRVLMMHNFHRNVATPAADFTGAMAITNSAPHEFDIVRHVLGAEFVSVIASQPKRSDRLVAPVVMVLETNDDQIVTIEINNNAAYGYDVRAELVGEAGSMAINPVAFTRRDAALAQTIGYNTDWRSRYAEAYRRQMKAFLRFVETGDFPEIASNVWDGYAASVVAEAGVQALASGEKVKVKMMPKPELYA